MIMVLVLLLLLMMMIMVMMKQRKKDRQKEEQTTTTTHIASEPTVDGCVVLVVRVVQESKQNRGKLHGSCILVNRHQTSTGKKKMVKKMMMKMMMSMEMLTVARWRKKRKKKT